VPLKIDVLGLLKPYAVFGFATIWPGVFFAENLEETDTNHEKVAGDGFMMVEGEA
jgi:hypothetical protein